MLNQLKRNSKAKKKKKCLGRGMSSGKGKTCGRGGKGQTARSGVSLGSFEGGQMPLYRRLPKRGFNPLNKKEFRIINLYQINSLIENKKLTQDIKISDFIKLGIINSEQDKLKLLGQGCCNKKLTIETHSASKKLIKNAKKNDLVIKLI